MKKISNQQQLRKALTIKPSASRRKGKFVKLATATAAVCKANCTGNCVGSF